MISDSEMSMRQQVNSMTSSTYDHIRAISRIRRNLDSETCAAIMRAFILSRLDYMPIDALPYGLPGKTLRKLPLVQNNAARLVNGAHRYAHISPLLCQSHWLPVCQRIKHKLRSLTFNILHSNTPPQYLKEILLTYRTRHRLKCI